MRAWAFTERSNRHTLQRRDLLCAIMSSHMYDFLIDITMQMLAEMRGEEPPPPIPLGDPPDPSTARPSAPGPSAPVSFGMPY